MRAAPSPEQLDVLSQPVIGSLDPNRAAALMRAPLVVAAPFTPGAADHATVRVAASVFMPGKHRSHAAVIITVVPPGSVGTIFVVELVCRGEIWTVTRVRAYEG